MSTLRTSLISVVAAVLTLVALYGVSAYAATTWTAAPLNPPEGNVAGPLSTGNGTQTKAGGDINLGNGGNLFLGGKGYSASTITTDSGSTLVTKDYVDGKTGNGELNPFAPYIGHEVSCKTSSYNVTFKASVDTSGQVTVCSQTSSTAGSGCKTFPLNYYDGIWLSGYYNGLRVNFDAYATRLITGGGAGTAAVFLNAYNHPTLMGEYCNDDQACYPCATSF